METNTFSSTIVHERLRRDNYANWSASMKSYLLAHDLWDIVEGTTEPPKPKDVVGFKAWRKNNAAALHAIQISCEVDILSKIREISSAQFVWDELATMYGPCNSSNIPADSLSQIVWDKLATIFYEPGNSTNISVFNAGKGSINNDLGQYSLLRTAISNGNWVAANNFLSYHDDAKSAIISVNGGTVLHVAVLAGHTGIVEKLVELMSEDELAIKDDNGLTALAQAAILQNTQMVDCMLGKNTNLLDIPDYWKCIPLVTALEYGNIEVARHLYSISLPRPTLSNIDASTVLHLFILRNNFDLALNLLRHYPSAAIVPNKYDASPLAALAEKSSAFRSGNQLVFWKNWIYACIPIPYSAYSGEIEIGISGSVPGLSRWLPSNLLKLLGIKQIYEMKLLDLQAHQLLHQMCIKVKEMNADHVNRAIFQAIKGGIIEFIDEIVNIDPQILCTFDAMGRDTFFCAVLHRQVNIFSLISKLDARTSITNALDRSGSTILHMAAMLEPSTTRDRIPGEALKMQSEVQWFKKVERICPPWIHEIRNNTNMTARELFTHNHKNMMKEGERWAKETASACTVIGALIITIMFTAAFTVPGGNDQSTGFPIFSRKKLFTVFIISDALSLFLSSTSVLIFLGIVTSRYAEEDFSRSLPLKIIIGHYTLFFSIATMMIAFCAGLFIMLPEKSWMVIPAICLASVTVIQFAFILFPLLLYVLKHMLTSGLGIKYLRYLF